MAKPFQQHGRLRQERLQRNWRQADVAEQLGTTELTVRRWEQGRQQPGAYYRLKLCALFGKSAQELGLLEGQTGESVEHREPDAAESSPLTRDHRLPLWHVPFPRNPFFTGRSDVLEHLHDRLQHAQTLALTQSWAISGLGGIGKTQTVIEYAYRYASTYTALFWINAETAESLFSSFVAIADVLNLREKAEYEQRRMVTAVLRWLNSHRQWLLIFDNVEDIELVQDFLPSARQGALLFTSRRQALGLSAQSLDLETMTTQEGMRLLLHRSRWLDPAVSLEHLAPADEIVARKIVEALGGLPLALDQAGAYIEETRSTLEQYLHCYHSQQVQLLQRRGHNSQHHPAPAAMTLLLSFHQLEQVNPAAAELLQLYAFLAPDAIPEELLTDGAAHWPPLLQQAVADPLTFNQMLSDALRFSLLRRQAAQRVLSVHRLVQVVLRDSLPGHVQDTWISRLIHHLNSLFPGESYAMEGWPWCEQVAVHVVTLLRFAQQAADPLEVASLSFKLATYFQQRGRYLEAEHYYHLAVDLREKLLGADHPGLIDPLIGLAEAIWSLGAYARVQLHAQRVIALLERTQGPYAFALTRPLNFLAQIAREQGRFEEAEGLFVRSLAIWARTRERENAGLEPSPPPGACSDWEAPETPALLRQVFALWEQAPRRHHDPLGLALTGLSQVYQQQQRDREAEAILLPLLQIGQLTLGERHPLHTYPGMILAEVYRMQGRLAEAEECYQWSQAVREEAWGVHHSRTKEARAAYAALLRAMDREDEAALLEAAQPA